MHAFIHIFQHEQTCAILEIKMCLHHMLFINARDQKTFLRAYSSPNVRNYTVIINYQYFDLYRLKSLIVRLPHS